MDYLEKLAGKLRGLTKKEIVGLVRIFTQSAADFLDEWFESEEVKVTLATDGVIGANGGNEVAWNSLHSAAPLHMGTGRRERASRLMGICSRRHGLRYPMRSPLPRARLAR